MINKKILILGHTGFVGRELFKKLKSKKINFDCYSKSQIIFNNKILKKKTPNILNKLIKKNSIIINCVGENFEKKFMNSRNYIFVKKILHEIEKTKMKKIIIHLSSCAVYGSHFHLKNSIISENTYPDPISEYAKTKLKGEKIIINNKNNRLNYVIIRPSQVVGENMNAVGFINLAKFIKKRIFVYVSTINAVRNYVNSEDLINLVLKILISNKTKNKIYIISRYSRLESIINYIQKRLKMENQINIVVPKFPLILIVSVLRFFYKDFPVSKEIIEGLSITTKIKSNIFKDFKNFKLNNINGYLTMITK